MEPDYPLFNGTARRLDEWNSSKLDYKARRVGLSSIRIAGRKLLNCNYRNYT